MDKATMHADICKNLNDLYQRKNHDYGDSFGKSYQEYGMTMACIRLEDKLNRLKSLCKQEAKVQDESLEDTLMDLANYAIMTLVERKNIQVIADRCVKMLKMPDPMANPAMPEGLSIEAMEIAIDNVCRKMACGDCPLYNLDGKCFNTENIERNYKAMLEAGCFGEREE